MNRYWGFLFAIGFFNSPANGESLPQCHPYVCANIATQKFDPQACFEIASWVAVGKITSVKRKSIGDPLNKDFSEFTFEIEKWEKEPQASIKSIKFKVGWCKNMRPLPSDTKGKFRIYGRNLPNSPVDPITKIGPEYFDLEKI